MLYAFMAGGLVAALIGLRLILAAVALWRLLHD